MAVIDAISAEEKPEPLRTGTVTRSPSQPGARTERTAAREEAFHNAWASEEDVSQIDVRRTNEACTASELRYIHQRLGDLRGKRILDIGSGLGEASVHFALRGAQVTALDISVRMLDLTSALAERYGVSVRTHHADVNSLRLDSSERYEIVHAANVLHHLDLDQALPQMGAHLKPAGTGLAR